MQTIILLFQCRDQKGIVAKVSDFIFRHGGNIITADQHSTDPEGGHFFMRIEFCLDAKRFNHDYLAKQFKPVARKFSAKWNMYFKDKTLNMGILVSKPDHCLSDLLYLYSSGELKVTIPFVMSNFEGHRDIVERYGVPFHFIPATKNNRREKEIISLAREADFLVLARYMLRLTPQFLRRFGKDIINIHHGLLPSFKGANPYWQAYEKGVKVTGATAHFVNESLDEGPIISQAVEAVSHRDDVAILRRKGKNLEKRALSSAIFDYLDYRIIRHRNRTIVF